MNRLFWTWIFCCALVTGLSVAKAQQDGGATAQDIQDWREEYREEIKQNLPILFYGKVVDQNGQGIPGVKVKAKIQAFNDKISEDEFVKGLANSKSEGEQDAVVFKRTTLELATNDQGIFSISNMKGRELGIKSIEKNGFKPDPMLNVNFVFSFFSKAPSEIYIPDPKKPVLFYLWKSVGTEPLIQVDGKRYGLGVEGKIYTVDLLKEKQLAGANADGDIRVQLKRPAQIKPNAKYEWSFVMEVVGGGVIETNDRFLYLAPESGYKPRYELTMSPLNPAWSDKAERRFYLRSRNGKIFASLKATIWTEQSGAGLLEINYLANPSGSRSLEPDIEKAIDPGRISAVGLEKAIEEVKAKSGK